ncbi:hypothetical protein BIFGAL_03387 [Bifidobacterium gallicum DSM 20093 = LMG 11596]|uniref:Uncharacterized protein n=1 Tax=Bifidobacterium gallicum DSM 20093 = LMG 11596 TaxID=561180 RepID=D1NU66_9BIFI|nr:hypothetical protein BIFGAL_03387 [Bifidobacterium gallicum DSM 20093 = LMG 11596]
MIPDQPTGHYSSHISGWSHILRTTAETQANRSAACGMNQSSDWLSVE